MTIPASEGRSAASEGDEAPAGWIFAVVRSGRCRAGRRLEVCKPRVGRALPDRKTPLCSAAPGLRLTLWRLTLSKAQLAALVTFLLSGAK